MRRPTTIRYGQHLIPVIWHEDTIGHEDDLVTVYEEVDGDNGMLILKGRYEVHIAKNAVCVQEVLLHEIMHAMVRHTGLHRGPLACRCEEEQVVTALAAGVVEVLVRNKALVDFLTERNDT